jgi:glycosyltransferase involved in cell wall biosynthesis
MSDVSVVTAVYNNAATLPAQLEALANQEFAGTWELIIVDNGSSDRSVEVIQEWSGRLPSVRLLQLPGS